MENLTISITIHGSMKVPDWNQFYADAKTLTSVLGHTLNYMGLSSSVINSSKVKRIPKNEEKLLSQLGDNTISHLALLSLPEGFKTAYFDYDVMIVRNQEYISIVFNATLIERIHVPSVIECFAKYSDISEIQIYEMDRYESPLIFASKANPDSCFPSLRMLSVNN